MGKPRQRARYEKSTLGCKTCKIRRVKCDETQPECLNCTKTGRRCEGPLVKTLTFVADSTVQLIQPTPEVVVSPDRPVALNRPAAELQAFSCFVNEAAPVLTGQVDIGLWGYLIPQIAQSNNVVWYTLIAIGSLWGLPAPTTVHNDSLHVSGVVAMRRRAFQWYACALSNQRAFDSVSNTPERLLTCIIFCNFEFQMQNLKNGLHMLRTGFKLLAPSMLSVHRLANDSLMDALMNMYMRHACSISTSKPPILPGLCTIQDFRDSAELLFQLFLSVYGLIKDIYFAAAQPETGLLALLKARRIQTMRQLDHWHVVNSEIPAVQNDKSSCSAGVLSTYHKVISSWLTTISILDDPAMTADECSTNLVDQARRIINTYATHTVLESLPAYFFDISILPPLYFIVMMSSNSHIKDQAFRLMRENTSQKTGEQDHTIVLTQRREGMGSRMHWVKVSQTKKGKESSIVRYADIDD